MKPSEYTRAPAATIAPPPRSGNSSVSTGNYRTNLKAHRSSLPVIPPACLKNKNKGSGKACRRVHTMISKSTTMARLYFSATMALMKLHGANNGIHTAQHKTLPELHKKHEKACKTWLVCVCMKKKKCQPGRLPTYAVSFRAINPQLYLFHST